MHTAQVDDRVRREVLERYDILGTPPEESFDRLSRMCARHFGVPIALISFIDNDRQWLKAHLGVEFCSVDRDISICARVAESGEVLVIEDALLDPRYCDSPLVTGPPGIRFYAGAPLTTAEGVNLGTLCLIDTHPRSFGDADRAMLVDFSAEALELLERRRAENEARRAEEAATEARTKVEEILESISDAFFTVDSAWRFTYINDVAEPLLRRERRALLGKNMWEEFPEAVGSVFYDEYQRAVRERVPARFTAHYAPFNAWFEIRAYPFDRGLSVHFADVTEQVLEQEFRAAEAKILEMISAGTPLRETLDALVRAVEARSSGFVGSVLLLGDDGVHLHHGAAPNLPKAYKQAIEGIAIGPMVGSCGTAAHSRETVVVTDIEADPRWADFRVATAFGLRACWSRPILDSEGAVLGTFALYYGEPRSPTEADLALIDRAGHLAGIVIERSRRARALRESEQRFRSLIEATTSIVWTTPASGEFETEQPAWSAFTGQSIDAYRGWGWMEAVHPEDRAETANAWNRALAKRALYEVEQRLRHHDGEYRHMQVRAVPVLDESGEVTEWVGVHTDVTERKRMDEALRENRERLSAIVHQAVIGILQVDLNGRICLANDSFARLVGRSVEALLEMRLQDILHPEDVADSKLLFNKLLIEGGKLHLERRYVCADGGVVWVDKTLSLVRDAEGNPLYVIAVVQDITDRKRVAELERSNRELEQFAYVASHDLQEPLRKIHSFSDLLASEYGDRLDEMGRTYVERVQQATTRMQALIKDLLAYSRVTTNVTTLEQVDLQVVVRGVLSDLEPRIGKRNAEVRVGPLPTIYADPLQMRQLFQNLISNALKFSKEDARPVVRVYAEQAGSERKGSAEFYRLCVEDNGIGFDEKYLDRIFAPFQRLHRRNEYEGTGIGLAICKKIAERHGGEIRASSAPGEGATFVVTLPVEREEVVARETK